VLKKLHHEATGQVALYQNEDRYETLLAGLFGARFHAYRQRWRAASQRGDPGDFPLSLDLAINSGCQLRCLMCPLPSRSPRVRLMPEALYERLMAQAREHRLPALTLGLASEPLLHPRAMRTVRLAARAGVMDIRLGTNGAALNEQIIDEAIDSRLTRLEVSLDAARASTYALIRGGDFDRLTRAIDLFLAKRLAAGSPTPLLRLSFLMLPENKNELRPFLARWADRADLISIQSPIWFPGSARPRPQKPGRPQASACAQAWQRLAVNHDGHVWPCCSWYGEELLTLNAGRLDIADIWRSAEVNELRANLAGPPEKTPGPCRLCEF
jgi:MoaA/NifB/PqqE/SkfB family radical SAM enzyme